MTIDALGIIGAQGIRGAVGSQFAPEVGLARRALPASVADLRAAGTLWGNAEVATILKRLGNIVRRHWSERARYPATRDWLMSIYNRVLVHARRVPLPGRGRLWRVRPAGEPAPVVVRLGTSDWYCLEEMFLLGEYQMVWEHLGRGAGANVRTVVDLGANVGMSVRLWREAYPGVRVVAVEPDAANLEMARRNLAAAGTAAAPGNGDAGSEGGAGGGVTFIEACIAARPGSVYLDRSGGAYAFRMKRDDGGGGGAVEAITVAEVLRRAGVDGEIDLLKCDIEGAEAEVFSDCAEWIGRVKNLVIEIHAPYTLERLLTDLRAAGAAPCVLFEQHKGDLGVALIKLGSEGRSSA
jgi:FkbM family methyltransferase